MIIIRPIWNEELCAGGDCTDYNWCDYCDLFIYWVTMYDQYMFRLRQYK